MKPLVLLSAVRRTDLQAVMDLLRWERGALTAQAGAALTKSRGVRAPRLHRTAVFDFVLYGFAMILAATGPLAGAESPPRDFTSKVPQYKFSRTLEAQEQELRTNPLLQRMNESRRKLAADPLRPIYHYVNPEGKLNDPNGLCFWQGRWHLFYQAYPPEDPRQHWGHAVSDDLIHWRDLPLAIYPNPEDMVFSGSTLVDGNRVIAMYHGVAAGTMVAVSSDPLLLNWEKVTGNAVIPLPKPGDPSPPYTIFDPCIWKQGEYYYALTAGRSPKGPGGKSVRAHFLHRSRDLAKWEYLHEFIDGYDFSRVGDDGACPYFWPIGDRHILLHFTHRRGAKWLLGDYDTQRNKFVVTNGGDFNHGPVSPSGVHAPSATPDGRGGVIALFNMNAGKPTRGWNQIMTLPQRLTLLDRDELGIEPAGAIESLRQEHQRVAPLTLPANQEVVLDKISGNALELAAEIELKESSTLELNVLRSRGREEYTRIVFYGGSGFRRGPPAGQGSVTRFCIDTSYSSLSPDVRPRAPETADVFLPANEPLKLRVFVDRSVVEVFANGRQFAAVRVYPSRSDSVGVSLRSQGTETQVRSLDAWQMKSIY